MTVLTLLADAHPQRFEVCDHMRHIVDNWDDIMQEPLQDLDEMSKEVGPLRIDNGDLLDNNDYIRENSGRLTYKVRMNNPCVHRITLYSNMSLSP